MHTRYTQVLWEDLECTTTIQDFSISIESQKLLSCFEWQIFRHKTPASPLKTRPKKNRTGSQGIKGYLLVLL
ncbi:hypothetical protein EYC80_008870 [Monilinia laxa]|uniref:Uncharacterized protein n=1 Tax=Monilinia laxa TaxID=61186 RepID=A0A5N6K1N4_MONLA|nr:hypothetical protein EYC80_008870 [Monilinia laxa]